MWYGFQQMYTRDEGNTNSKRQTHSFTLTQTINATVMFTSHAEIADIFCDVKSNDISNNAVRAQHSISENDVKTTVCVCVFAFCVLFSRSQTTKSLFMQMYICNGFIFQCECECFYNFHITRMAVGYSNVLWFRCVFLFILLLLKCILSSSSWLEHAFRSSFILNGCENRNLDALNFR